MQVTVKLFAFLADQLGDAIQVDVDNPVKVADLFDQVADVPPL